MAGMEPLDRVRAILMALPEVNERPSHGEPAWFYRDKRQIAMYSDHHHGDPHLSVWCAATPEAQAMLVAEDPARFFVPPYVGHRGWVGIRLDVGASSVGDDSDLEELLRESYRLISSKRG